MSVNPEYESPLDWHPELKDLREFRSEEEIVDFLRGGATIYCTMCCDNEPIGVYRENVLEVDVYGGPCKVLAGFWIYYVEGSLSDAPIRMFVSDLQNGGGKAVFSTKERAEDYFAQCFHVYNHDPKWQAQVRLTKQFIDRLWGLYNG